jgi:uncharacterized lipoprotein YmbA
VSGASIPMVPRVPLVPIVSVVRVALVLGLLAVLAGCGSVPRENLYTLDAVAVPERASTANSVPGFAVIVDAATVPELVDRPQFVVSVGESRVSILEQQRWAAPLKTQISRTVAMNLARLLGTTRVSTNPQAGGSDTDYRVTLDVQRFEARPGDAVVMEVLWSVRRGNAAEAKTGRSAVQEKIGPDGYDALVAAHNRALATISREIAAAIKK